MKVYVAGSLRNPRIPEIAEALREAGYDAFDDWYSVGPKADDHWLEHQKFKGLTFKEALAGPAAVNTFKFDKGHLDSSDAVVLVMPAGKSAHLELGYCAGKGIPTFVLFPDGEPERWDMMYQFADSIEFSLEDVLAKLEKYRNRPLSGFAKVPSPVVIGYTWI